MIKNKIKIALFTLIYIVLTLLSGWYFYQDKQNRLELYLSQKIITLQSEYRAAKNSFKKLSDFTFDEIMSNKTFLQTFLHYKQHQASIQDLYKMLLPHYKILQKYSIDYLAILDSFGHTIINMPKASSSPQQKKPQLFSPTRTSLLLIEFQKQIYYKNRFLGFYKSAVSYNVMKKELAYLFKKYYEYIIKKDVINKSIFKYGNYSFIQSDINKNYFYQKSGANTVTDTTKTLITQIDNQVKDMITTKLDTNKSFAIVTSFHGNHYIITFLPIKNKKLIGYLLSYTKDNTIATFTITFWQNILLINIIIIVILLFIYRTLQMKTKFEILAITDKLTKLYNRHKFYEIAGNEIERAKRYKRPLSLIIFDIDHFKKINDTYGHDVGDYVLQELAKLIKKHIRKQDFAFRWGGEEFIILLPETNAQGAMKLAEKLRHIIETHKFKKVGRVTISLGVTEYSSGDKDIDEVVKRADNALYLSKKNGRNRATLAF